MIVVLHHVGLSVPEGLRTDFVGSLTDLLAAAARFAVLLFFVLSGFVLALPYFEETNDAYSLYLLRRFFRLYPPFAFAILVAALLRGLVGASSFPFLSHWLSEFWSGPLTVGVVASHLLMTDIHRSASSLDPPIWTLIVEMRIALVFPLLVLVVKRFGWLSIVAALIVALICSKTKAALGEPSTMVAESVAGAFLLTGRYVFFFLLGIFAACRLDQHRKVLVRISAKQQTGVFIGLVFLCGFLTFTSKAGDGYIDTLFGLLATYLITLCAAFPRVAAKLSGRLCLWLGDISYSLYLIHLPVLMAVFILLYGHASFGATVALAFPLMLLAGHAMYYLIEWPSMKVGRKLARRW